MAVPYTFATATTTLPLSQLDTNFAYFGNAITVAATSTSMTIDSSKNVGIGTSSPASRLEVVGANVLVRSASSSGYAGFYASAATGNAAYNFFAVNGTETARIFSDAGNGIYFGTGSSGTERMRIDSSGNLLVGTTTSGGKVFSYQNSASTNIGIDCGSSMGANAALWTRVASTSTVLAYYLYNATNVGSITTNGTTTSYNVSSDYRLKEKVTSLTSGLSTISQLNPVAYEWISDKSQGEGFIAHELQAVIPHAVFGEKDAVNDDGSIKPQGVDYSKIVVHLVAAIQELSAKNDALETRLAALEAK
jgi:hypothetical protein